ncbi:MAG TPA: DUF433 domain-containing protein [Longimicrobiales bacterium]|nr:DUF433 domain-containing protein [Longimicrobiales bacterium]
MHDVHTRGDDDDLPIDEPEPTLDEAEPPLDEAPTGDSPEAAAAPETSETPRLSSRPKGIRVPYDIDRALQDEMKRRGVKEWSTMVVELVDEALRMRRAPGVVFVDGPVGRRPVIAGTGLDVWEVIATWQEVGRDYRRLRAAYEWLTEPQLRAALSYYESYAREIDERLERERELTPEVAQAAFPFIRAR